MKTEITELLAIEHPVIQGGMAWIAEHNLAAAVSNAGGLGIIAAGSASYDYVKAEIEKARELTDKPFGVNIMLLSPHADDIARLMIEERIPVVTTGGGSPARYVKPWKAAGIKVIPVVASVALARMMERDGADAIIAEGSEAGGHIGESSTMTLVPQVADAVSVPVIAAGGIGDGRGFAAAMMLGARGVQMGTRFLVAKECTIEQGYKDKVIGAKDISTVVMGRLVGHPIRCIRNQMTRDYIKAEKAGASFEDLEKYTLGALKRAAFKGDITHGSLMSGQIAGMVKKEETAAEMIEEIIADAQKLLGGSAHE